MDIIEAIRQLIDAGLALAVLAAVVAAFLTDNLSSGKSRDREIARERELTDKAIAQLDGLTDAIRQMSDAWEKQTDIAEALAAERVKSLKEQSG